MCMGTGCSRPAIGCCKEYAEIPQWRHPADRPANHMAFSVSAIAHYCAEHEAAAKATYLAIRSTNFVARAQSSLPNPRIED